PSKVAGKLVAGFPSDREMADLAPILVVTEAPVAHDFSVERAADTGEERGKSVGAFLIVVGADTLTAPLHGERPQAPGMKPLLGLLGCNTKICVAVLGTGLQGRIVEPKSAGVPGAGQRMLDLRASFLRLVVVPPGADKHVRHMLLAANRFVTEKQRPHLAFD